MKKNILSIIAGCAAIAMLALLTFPADAGVNRIAISSVEYDCFTGIENIWGFDGQTLHVRGVTHTNFDVSASPELNGVATTVASGDFTPNGYAIRGTFHFEPYEIDGTWEGTWTWTENKVVISGRSVAQGTGELEGKTLFLELFDIWDYDPELLAAYCEGIGEPEGVVGAVGYILDTTQ